VLIPIAGKEPLSPFAIATIVPPPVPESWVAGVHQERTFGFAADEPFFHNSIPVINRIRVDPGPFSRGSRTFIDAIGPNL
jgi:hypothetical protein